MESNNKVASTQEHVDGKQLNRAIFTGCVGSALEYYDFAIYGLASALVFGHIFFPSMGTTGALLASFATYGAGFLARPFGGLFFGSLGDRKGRKLVLIITIALMGFSTTLIGLLPAGPIGAVLLVLLRLAQGFGAGAEQAGATTLMAEMSPVKRRGWYAALPFVGVFSGLALATVTFRIMQMLLSQEQILSWGWRIPFLLSVILIGIAIWVRLKLKESPVFKDLEKNKHVIKAPMREVITHAKRPLLATVLMRLADTGGSTLYTTVSIAFLTGYVVHQQSGLTIEELSHIGTNAVLIASILSVISTPMFGAISDKVGRIPVYRWGALFAIIWAVPSWYMIASANEFWITVAITGGFAIGANSVAGASCSHFSELFGNKYRYSGVALAREIGALLSGGLAPLLGIFLIGLAGGAPWVLGLYTAVLAALTLIGSFISTETRGRDLTDLNDAI